MPTLTFPSKARSLEISILMMRSPGLSVMSETRGLISSRWRFMRSVTLSVWTTATSGRPSCTPATPATRLDWTWPRMTSRGSSLYTELLMATDRGKLQFVHAHVLYCELNIIHLDTKPQSELRLAPNISAPQLPQVQMIKKANWNSNQEENLREVNGLERF